jgi:hypothetical protein
MAYQPIHLFMKYVTTQIFFVLKTILIMREIPSFLFSQTNTRPEDTEHWLMSQKNNSEQFLKIVILYQYSIFILPALLWQSL